MDGIDYRNAFKWAGDALLLAGRTPGTSYRVMDVNRAWERLAARSRTDFVDRTFGEAFGDTLAAKLSDACERCVAVSDTIELRIDSPFDGMISQQSWTLSPVTEPSTSTQQVVISARARVSEAPDKAPPQYDLREVLEQISDTVSHFDCEGRLLFVNAPIARSFKGLRVDAIGRTVLELFPDSENAKINHAAALAAARTGELQEIEIEFSASPGVEKWYQVRFAPIRDAEGTVRSVISVGREITALKRAEQKLRRTERQFRTLAENSPDCILRFDRQLRLIYANPILQRFTGIRVAEFLDAHLEGMIAGQPGGSPDEAAAAFRETLTKVLRERRAIELEIRDRPANAPVANSYIFAFVPEFDGNGELESILTIGRDITQLKAIEADLRMLNATLEQRVAARTSALELANRDLRSFAHTVSHDLRAPLRAIIGYSTLLEENEGDRVSARGRELLERIRAAGLKLSTLIDQILEYSRASQAEVIRRPVALDQIARDLVAEMQVQYPTATIDVAVLPNVNGDPTMLRQVLQNLIGNALKFSAHRAHPHVEVDYMSQDEETVFFVRDNGAGFDMRYVDKLGSMFQRLHNDREFPGSGVGLAIVHRLIERHGGRLWASSEVDAGATFFFTVPSAVGEMSAADH